MRVTKCENGYCMWVSANDTYNWAHKVRANWPCSQLSGHKFFVAVDANGLYDFILDGRMVILAIDNTELMACVEYYLPTELKKYWPCWE